MTASISTDTNSIKWTSVVPDNMELALTHAFSHPFFSRGKSSAAGSAIFGPQWEIIGTQIEAATADLSCAPLADGMHAGSRAYLLEHPS